MTNFVGVLNCATPREAFDYVRDPANSQQVDGWHSSWNPHTQQI